MRGSAITSPNAHDDARRDALPDAHGPNSHRSSLDTRRNSRSRSEDRRRSRIRNADTRIRSRRSGHNHPRVHRNESRTR